ncbi:lipopolysaccharide biosynthesis protein [Solicola sp. PLA-1-18]|uniref:lipopolysaccharide biosynthesis protein n=1 Tax=Solicola sp. PLA-1-18 TaxID=3380532 RepID=UPI003B7DB0EB
MTTDARPTRRLVGTGSRVAIAMVVMNAAVYLFNVVAARALEPRDLGAVAALLGVVLVGNVASLAVQATTARRIAVEPGSAADVVATAGRVSVVVAVVVGALAMALSPVLERALRLDSVWPVLLCGASLVPLTVMGAVAGVAQGSGRWGSLSSVYVVNGLGRLLGGSVAVLVSPTVTAAMLGIAVGAWAPVLAGLHLLRRDAGTTPAPPRPFVREAVRGSHALLAYVLLSNLDALLARSVLSPHDSGLYASGLILAKAALFLPQFVSVVLFPDLARSTGHRARLRAVGLVAGLGAVAVAATAALPQVALVLVGGGQYREIADLLWLFALSGSVLAIVHLLVFDALARQSHGVIPLLWVASATVVVLAATLDLHVAGLATVVAGVAVATAVGAYAVSHRSGPAPPA